MRVVSNFFGLLTVVILFPGLSACTGPLNAKDYIAWVRDHDNGLRVTREANNFVFDLQYQPAEYVWLQRNKGDIKREEIRNDKLAMDELQYYTLTIGVKDNLADFVDYSVQSINEKQEKLYYLSYGFQQDIKLKENGRTLPCVLFHFERTLDLKPTRTFVLGFENSDETATEAKLIIDSDWLGSIPVKMKVSKENIPTLSYD